MSSTWFNAIALSTSFISLVAAQGSVIPTTCPSGVQVVALPGTGVPNGTYGLSQDIAYSILNAIPGSSTISWDYDRFPPNGDIGDYFAEEVGNGVAKLYTALQNFISACPKTPIVLHGYSEGAVIVSNLLCGCNWWWGTQNNPLDASFASHIIAAIMYGDETYGPGQPYSQGGCQSVAPNGLTRTWTSGCNTWIPIMQSYCWPNDPDCCSTANTNIPDGPDGNPWHWDYPYYDVGSTAFVVSRYNNYLSGATQQTIGAATSPSSVGSYNFQGCYTDSSNARALTASSWSASNMTIEQCATFCSGHGIFGVEFTDECYCGDYITSNSAVASGTDCAMLCEGNLAEICGGPSRLSLYAKSGVNLTPGATTTIATTTTTAKKTTISAVAATVATTLTTVKISTTTSSAATPTATVSSSLPSGVIAIGCYVDGSTRALPITAYSSSSNTPGLCALTCRASGYPFSGTEYGQECYCGYTAPSTPASASDCNVACAGDSSKTCGGGWRLTVAQDTTLLSNSNLPSGVTQMGCFQDSSTRTFSNRIYTSSSNTDATCATACRAEGYPFSGTEYGVECWCGYSMPAASLAAPPTDCSFTCPGDSTEPCGASWRLSVQQNTNTVSPVFNPGTSGMSLQGCYSDSSTRTLATQVASSSSMTVATCISKCQAAGYSYCGLENGQECWASNTAPSASLLAAGNNQDMVNTGWCGSACGGNSTEICGGSWRLSVYH